MIYPVDIDEAYDAFGANCGPCSLAAILGQTVDSVRAYFEGFDTRRYVNPTHMKSALDAAQLSYRSLGPQRPRRGLIFVGWGGHEHKPIRVQYEYTHWIGIEDEIVFEVNAPELVTWTEWQRVMPGLMRAEKKGDGTFIIRSGLEVRLSGGI